jgi:hypothetical protein
VTDFIPNDKIAAPKTAIAPEQKKSEAEYRRRILRTKKRYEGVTLERVAVSAGCIYLT